VLTRKTELLLSFQSCCLAKSRYYHIVYIDKEIWGSPDDTLKQKILNDAKKNNNKVLVVYDSATGEKQIDMFIFVEVTAFMNYLEWKDHIISV
jgi:hypothetical protein